MSEEIPSETGGDPQDDFRAGFVAVMGRPNVGKSTLINALLQQTIAAVSPKPQTTRKRQMGILTQPDLQIIFEDTPGLHKPLHKLGECMNQEAIDALAEADLVIFMVDASRPPNEEDELLAGVLHQAGSGGTQPVILVLNKIDLADPETLEANQAAYLELVPQSVPVRVSASLVQNLAELVQVLGEHLPAHPPFFPEDQLTDLYERDIAADMIRAAAMNLLHDEVPYSIAVRVDEFIERNEHGAYLAATLFVERESQKGIVIGHGGSMLKEIGTMARQEIEAMSGRKVFLKLRVKVRKNWRNDRNTLRQFGFNLDRVQPLPS
jgi:GTP-binding protein Era